MFHNLAKYDGYRYCVSGEIKISVFNVILDNHAIKGLCDFMGKSHSN